MKLIWFITLLGISALLMAKENFETIDTENAAEWIYFTVMEGDNHDATIQLTKEALQAVFTDEPVISEKDIDEAIEDEIYEAKSSYELGDINKEEYEKWCSELVDREYQRNDLIKAGHGTGLEEGYAASELVVALLGRQANAFEHALDAYGDEFASKFKKITQDLDKETLIKLLPEVLEVIERLKKKESIEIMGYYGNDMKIWLDELNHLESQLVGVKDQ